MLFQGDTQQQKTKILSVYPEWYVFTFEVSVCSQDSHIPLFTIYSLSDYILQRYIFSNKSAHKKSKSSDLGFSSSFYLKLVGPGCCDWRRDNIYPCRLYLLSGHMYTVHMYSAQRLLVLLNVGEVFSCVRLQNSCCQMASLCNGWEGGAGVGAYIQFTTFSHALTHASTHTHTHPDSYTVQHFIITDSEH